MATQANFASTQDLVDNTCGGFDHIYFNQQQEQQLSSSLQFVQSQTVSDQNVWFDNNVPVQLMNIEARSMECHLRNTTCTKDLKYKQEMDRFISSQNKRLRLLIEEQTKQNITMWVKILESRALPLLRQTEEAISQSTKKKLELENSLKKLELEKQIWQRIAQDNEAMVASLNNTIDQLREKGSCSLETEAAESCCEVNNEVDASKMRLWLCVCCVSRSCSVVLLPCRHLCSCKECEMFLQICPVCQSPKEATIEAFMV